MRKPFKVAGRDKWQAEFDHPDGRRERRSFARHKDADDWLILQQNNALSAQAPLFGGPSQVTLGRMLGEYAARFTIAKDGYKAEMARVSHYTAAVGLPRLTVRVEGDKRHLEKMDAPAQELPGAFQKHLDARMALRERTYQLIGQLARKLASKVTTDDIQRLKTTMLSDGLSDSTVQKEIALLKHAFNQAASQWRWQLPCNPCVGVELGSSAVRFVKLTADDEARLYKAISECDNPQFWPLVQFTHVTTLRAKSLRLLTWDQINRETGEAQVWMKGKWKLTQFSSLALEILSRVPASGTNQVFTMSANAIDMAWDGVRQKAGLPKLQFRDLRHLGATFYARNGMGAHALKNVLGHTTTRMAEVYVNLANSEVRAIADKANEGRTLVGGLPPPPEPGALKKKPRLRGGMGAPTAAANLSLAVPSTVAKFDNVVPFAPRTARVAG